MPEDDKSMVLSAYMAASRAVFLMQIPLIGTCFLLCIFIKDRGLQPAEDGGLSETTEGKNYPNEQVSSASGDMLVSDSENSVCRTMGESNQNMIEK